MGSPSGQGGGFGGWGGGQGYGGGYGGFGGGYGGGYGRPAPKVGYGGQMGTHMPMVETGVWRGPAQGGAMGKMGGGISQPLDGLGAMTGGNMAGQVETSRPLDSYGGWGRPQMPDAGFGGFDPRTGSMGAPPMATTNGPMGAAPAPQPAPAPTQAAPMQPPMGAAPAVQPPAFDYGQVFGNLYGQNPAAAYKFVDGTDPSAGDWFQKNQMQIRDSRFGGNQDAMNAWMNTSFYNQDRGLRDVVNNTVAGYRR